VTAPDQLQRKSVTIAGHRTSVTLEAAFWQVLDRLAKTDGRSRAALIQQVDAGRSGTLSSALRVYVLNRLDTIEPTP